jgi:hypothetical protein
VRRNLINLAVRASLCRPQQPNGPVFRSLSTPMAEGDLRGYFKAVFPPHPMDWLRTALLQEQPVQHQPAYSVVTAPEIPRSTTMVRFKADAGDVRMEMTPKRWQASPGQWWERMGQAVFLHPDVNPNSDPLFQGWVKVSEARAKEVLDAQPA